MFYFLHPWGLFALLSLGAVVFLYYFVFRGRRIPVSSLHLWALDRSMKMEGKHKKRPPVTLPFLLELLCALILSLTVAGLVLQAKGSAPYLVVILDGSASMNAGAAGDSLPQRAARKVEEVFDDLGEGGRITLIESGFEPRIQGSESMGREEARQVLASWRPAGPTHSMEPTLELAHALTGGETEPILLTDRCEPVEGAHTIALGSPWENTGWTGCRWTGGDELFALVAHFGEGGARKTIAVFGDGRRIGESVVDFSKQKSVPLSVAIPPEVNSVLLELPEDALENDNILRAARPRHMTIPAGLDLDDPSLTEYVRRAAEASGRIKVSESAGSALLFCKAGSREPAAFRVGFHEADAEKPYTSPFRIDGFHPLSQGISLDGVIWAADPGFDKAKGKVLLAAGEVPLAVIQGDELLLNLSVKGSNVFSFPAWPVLVANIGEYVFERTPGLKRTSFRLGESLVFQKPASWNDKVEVESPSGERIAFEGDSIFYGRLEREGIYRLFCGGEERAALDVNLFSERESDLRNAASLEEAGGVTPWIRSEREDRSLDGESALAVLALLLLCWYLLERRTP